MIQSLHLSRVVSAGVGVDSANDERQLKAVMEFRKAYSAQALEGSNIPKVRRKCWDSWLVHSAEWNRNQLINRPIMAQIWVVLVVVVYCWSYRSWIVVTSGMIVEELPRLVSCHVWWCFVVFDIFLLFETDFGENQPLLNVSSRGNSCLWVWESHRVIIIMFMTLKTLNHASWFNGGLAFRMGKKKHSFPTTVGWPLRYL